MTDALPYVVLVASLMVMLWRIRAKLLHGCDIMLALARGLYHRRNVYLSGGFKCGHYTVPSMLFPHTLSGGYKCTLSCRHVLEC